MFKSTYSQTSPRAIFLGWSVILIGLSFHALTVRTFSVQAKEVPPTAVSEPQKTAITPSHLEIPWKVNTPLQKGIWDGQGWNAPHDGAAYWQRDENLIIYGHNTRQILGNIRALQGGEVITLEKTDGSEVFYKVQQVAEVTADQTQWLEPTSKKVLTLYTCSGWWDKQRFVVRAEPL